ncbi:S-Ena type endospore appendage [Gracilibacillus sp. S3-1-1]|uniref:S-Ena type endospore appendage n=1 Tax=Gracilibacillus pellucidus TaxID=3095368 RepID=A0ACC6M764_9BACI|nr:S-Ena type endospore appendage [Gracilibacillus sp. S3-1-1]MDX8046784.1 S-Ena type endospore appendage [Gracilibacillus sp. S3-1-1]
MGKFCSNCNCGSDNGGATAECHFVKDQICVGWSVPQGISQDIYNTSGLDIVASGYLAYDEGASDFVTFSFYNGGDLVSGPLTVYEGSSIAFTSINFTRIEVTVPTGAEGDLSSGQICITPRYQIDCDL